MKNRGAPAGEALREAPACGARDLPVKGGNSDPTPRKKLHVPSVALLRDPEPHHVTFPVLENQQRCSRHLPEAREIMRITTRVSARRKGTEQSPECSPPRGSASSRLSTRAPKGQRGAPPGLRPCWGRAAGEAGRGGDPGPSASALPGAGLGRSPAPARPPLPHVLPPPPQ